MAEWCLLVCLITCHRKHHGRRPMLSAPLPVIWNFSRTLDTMFHLSCAWFSGIAAFTILRFGNVVPSWHLVLTRFTRPAGVAAQELLYTCVKVRRSTETASQCVFRCWLGQWQRCHVGVLCVRREQLLKRHQASGDSNKHATYQARFERPYPPYCHKTRNQRL